MAGGSVTSVMLQHICQCLLKAARHKDKDEKKEKPGTCTFSCYVVVYETKSHDGCVTSRSMACPRAAVEGHSISMYISAQVHFYTE